MIRSRLMCFQVEEVKVDDQDLLPLTDHEEIKFETIIEGYMVDRLKFGFNRGFGERISKWRKYLIQDRNKYKGSHQ